MKRPYKLLLASMLCAAPLGALLPGCGGGGGGSRNQVPDSTRTLGVELKNSADQSANPPILANIRVDWFESSSPKKRGVAQIQVLTTTATTPTAAPTATTTATAAARGAQAVQNDIPLRPATYICKGDITIVGNTYTLNFQGSYDQPEKVPFTLTGNFVNGGTVRITSQFSTGASELKGTLGAPNVFPTATPTFTQAPTGTPTTTGTPGATPIPTATFVGTPVATPVATITPVATATSVATPVPTATLAVTPVPTATIVGTSTPAPIATSIP